MGHGGEFWQNVAYCRVGDTECSSACMGPFEGGHQYLYHLHHTLASGQTTGREHSPAHQQKIGLKIYWAWPRPSEQGLVSPSVSLSHQEASISFLSLSIRGQTEWKPQSQKTNQQITWITALSNSMRLWAMPCRATKMDGSWWRLLTKCGPLEKGMVNHFGVLALRTCLLYNVRNLHPWFIRHSIRSKPLNLFLTYTV